MAVLTSVEVAELRQGIAGSAERASLPITHTKAQAAAIFQALEDWLEANRAAIGTAIETAAPGVLNATGKKRAFAYYMKQKFIREGV